jgi:hypothetical protein
MMTDNDRQFKRIDFGAEKLMRGVPHRRIRELARMNSQSRSSSLCHEE